MIKVYYGWPSIYGRKVFAVLAEKGLKYEVEIIKLNEQEHKSAAYLALNPNGQVPTLEDDGFLVYESTAIIEYLEEQYPDPQLMPKDPKGRARVRMVEDYCDQSFAVATRKCFLKQFVRKEPITEEDKAHLQVCAARIESYLGDGEFVAGSFSLADCSMMAILTSLEGLNLMDCFRSARLDAYAKRLKSRAGYAVSSPENFAPTAFVSS